MACKSSREGQQTLEEWRKQPGNSGKRWSFRALLSCDVKFRLVRELACAVVGPPWRHREPLAPRGTVQTRGHRL